MKVSNPKKERHEMNSRFFTTSPKMFSVKAELSII